MNCDFNHGLMRARGIKRCAECGELTPEKVKTSQEGITRQRDTLKAELDKALQVIIEQELEEARDTIEDQVDEMRGIARQRDALKAELDKALEIIAEQRKKIDRLQGSIAQYLTVIYSDHPRAQLTIRHD